MNGGYLGSNKSEPIKNIMINTKDVINILQNYNRRENSSKYLINYLKITVQTNRKSLQKQKVTVASTK